MHQTGYQRPWHRATKDIYGSRGGPIYMFMRLTIGSRQLPINIAARSKGAEDAYAW